MKRLKNPKKERSREQRMHSAVRNGQKIMALILMVTMKIVILLSSSLKKQRQAKRHEKQLKGPIGVGPQLTCGSPIVSAPLIQSK